MNDIITFQQKELKLTNMNNRIWLSASELAKGLGYARADHVAKIYNAHKDEFLADMTETAETALSGNLKTITRYFSPRGCHLIAMFARTPFAKEFRRWVLDVLEGLNNHPQNNLGLVPVSSYTRRLPSGPREIKLSDKARSEIGGIVKACIGSALKDITVTQTVDPIGYNIPESLKQPDVVPAEVEKELWRLTEQLHYGLQKQQPKAQNTSVLNLFYLLRALKTVLTRYRTVQNETLFAVDMMKGDKNYEKDEALERIYILNALTNGALRVC